MWFSIFIASRTHTVCPTSTWSPTATNTLTIVPCMGTVTLSELAAPPPDWLIAGRFRGLFAADAAATSMSGTHMRTW